MKRLLLSILASAVLAQPALALSCAPADLSRDFRAAAESEDTWVVVEGVVTPDRASLPTSSDDKGVPRTLNARLKGMSLGAGGFVNEFDADITVNVTCAGPWCGSVPSGKVLAFLRQQDGTLVMTSGPCPAMLYANPTDAQKAEIVACVTEGSCGQ